MGLIRISNFGCRFLDTLQKIEDKGTFAWLLRLQNELSSKSVGTTAPTAPTLSRSLLKECSRSKKSETYKLVHVQN